MTNVPLVGEGIDIFFVCFVVVVAVVFLGLPFIREKELYLG